MEIENFPVDEIIEKARQKAGGNPWCGYEYAKKETACLLAGKPPSAYDDAVRKIAVALDI